MQDITNFLCERKSEYQKRCSRAEKQEKQAREFLEDEPDREDVKSDLNYVIKLQDRYNALIELIDELFEDYFCLEGFEMNISEQVKKLSSIQPNVVEKVKAQNVEIVVHGTIEKPYYEIKYFDLSDGQYHIGYSSYDLDNVFRWREECFEIVNKPSTP